MSAEQPPITVGYWSIRGLAAPLRMMVMYADAPLNNVMYDLSEENGKFSGATWFSVKPELKAKNPLINLPYVIDGERIITQSNACFAYLGRKFNMWGTNDDEVASCEMLLCELMDLRDTMTKFAYGSDVEQGKALLLSVAGKNGILGKLESWLEVTISNGASGTFLVADRATAPDFHLYEMLLQYSKLAELLSVPSPIASFPCLTHVYTAFPRLPQNARYMASNIGSVDPIGLPFNNKMACFGATSSMGPWVSGTEYTFNTFTGLY